MSEPQAMMDGPLVHKLRAEDATSVTLVTVPPFGYNVNPEVWHVPTRVVAAIEAEAREAAIAEAEAAVAALPVPDAEYPWVPITTVLDALATLRSGGAG